MSIHEHGSGFQVKIKNKLLPKRGQHFKTFKTVDEARLYETEVLASLNRGVVPAHILSGEGYTAEANTFVKTGLLIDLIDGYTAGNDSISKSDLDLARIVKHYLNGTRVQDVNFQWLLAFTKHLRVKENLAPNSIRGRVGMLGRAWSWHHAHNNIPTTDYWSSLPENYSVVTSEAEKKEILENGGKIKRDTIRDRRLNPGEYENIILVLEGQRVLDSVKQPLVADPEIRMLFILITNTGMRLREAYKLRISSLQTVKGVAMASAIVKTSKTHHGDEKFRDVFLINEVREELASWIPQLGPGADRLFPGIWDGTENEDELRKTSNSIARKLKNVFKQAGALDLNEHDLRHEATCRWFMYTEEGKPGFFFHEHEIMIMMGWTTPRMITRYLSLRGTSASRAIEAGL